MPFQEYGKPRRTVASSLIGKLIKIRFLSRITITQINGSVNLYEHETFSYKFTPNLTII